MLSFENIGRAIQGLLALLVMFLVADIYANNGAGYGVKIDDYVYIGVLAISLAIPLFWAVSHLCMGIVMGLSGSGLWEGLRMGFLLGVGMALGKMWTVFMAAGVGILIGKGPQLYAYGLMALGALCFGMNRLMAFFWHEGHNEG